MAGEIDAAIYLPQRDRAYFFKGTQYIRYKPGEGVDDGPWSIKASWKKWPGSFSQIDAAVYWPENERIYFFKGTQYIRYKPGEGVDGGPWSIQASWKKWPDSFSQIDAAVYWPENKKFYFFKGTQYIRYKPGEGVDDGPWSIKDSWDKWPDSFPQIDAAVYWPTNKAYFFYGTQYIRYKPGEGVDNGPYSIKASWDKWPSSWVSKPGRRWITELPNSIKSKSISTLSIPGTHNSGTRGCALAAQCQDTSIDEQLDMGVRFFDIRLRSSFDVAIEDNLPVIGKLEVYHGIFSSGLIFDHVIESCRKFLRNNPNEFILMSVKAEGVNSSGGSDFSDAFSGSHEKDLEISKTVPTIKGAEGKIILLRRFNHPEVGIRLDIPDNTRNSGNIGRDNNSIWVQDEYERDLEQFYKKEKVVGDFLSRTSAAGLHLNFVSANGTWYGVPHPESMADKMNPWLAGELASRTTTAGVIIVDYIDKGLARKIYSINKYLK